MKKPTIPHPLKDIPEKPWLEPKTRLQAGTVRDWAVQSWRAGGAPSSTAVLALTDPSDDHVGHDPEERRDILNVCSELARRLLRVLYHAGVPGRCERCNVELVFIEHRNGRWAPYTLAGMNHFTDCTDPDAFHNDQKQKKAPVRE